MLTDKPRVPLKAMLLYGIWPSFFKVFLYRLRGYKIGKNVSIGFGSIIVGEEVQLGEKVSIGFLTIIRGKEIRIDDYVQIGSMTFLDTPHIEIGEGTKINEQVFVGGLQFPDSKFSVGRNCLIMQMSFINPAKSVMIGDDCGIGGHSLIFGHSSFQNHLEGYPVEFAPIEIGNGAGLAWRVFVLPGAKIGEGAMIGASSVVSGNIPPASLAVGFPARIVGKAPVFPRSLSDEDKVRLFRKIVDEFIHFLSGSGFLCERREDEVTVRKQDGGWLGKKSWKMRISDAAVSDIIESLGDDKIDVFLSLREIPNEMRDKLKSRGVMWIDLERKLQPRISNELGEEVLAFFRRYGVRTLRYPRP